MMPDSLAYPSEVCISPTSEIIDELRQGRMVIIIDEEDRENEGDLVFPAELIQAEHINFMARFGRGLICLTLTEAHCKKLALTKMVHTNGTSMHTNFTVSIEAASGVTTGISAADRARTIRVAASRNAKPSDIVSPGHVFPLSAKEGGVLVRPGHTEAGCDLANLAGFSPAAVICEIMNEDGSMSRFNDLRRFSAQHKLKIGSISDLIYYRSLHEVFVKRAAQKNIMTPFGEMQLVAYTDQTSNETHIALIKGSPKPDEVTLVRVHEPTSILDLLDSTRKTHHWNALKALKQIAHSQCGVMIMMIRNQRHSILDDIQHSDIPAIHKREMKDYGIGSQILRDLGIGKMRLMSSPRRFPSINGFNLDIVEFINSSGQIQSAR